MREIDVEGFYDGLMVVMPLQSILLESSATYDGCLLYLRSAFGVMFYDNNNNKNLHTQT